MGLSQHISASRRLTLDVDLPAGFGLDAVLVGAAGQEVLVAETGKEPTATELRRIHRERLGNRGVVLAVAAVAEGGTWILGPTGDGLPIGPLANDQAARILGAVLEERVALASRQRLVGLLEAASPGGVLVGVANSGLFATHYLERVPDDGPEWEGLADGSKSLVTLRGPDLIRGLGYRSEGLGAGALLLTVAEDPPHAVAVLVDESEGFDAVTTRFGVSPIQHGLAKAAQARVPWLVVLKGSQIRLYPVRPEVGVGRRSQAETYFELDLAVVDNRTAGFLPHVFAAGALTEGGTVDELLAGSKRYTTSLGERLRDRVYNHVVPALAVAVATELERQGRGDDLDTAYRVTLKILFRLLFQAYAEDQGLLPYGKNDRYTRNSLTTQANDFAERPDRELDGESHAIWDDVQQVWEVINTGNTDWDVPPYNGGLFAADPNQHPDGALIAEMRLSDVAVGTALRHLLCDSTDDGGLGVVDFRSLSVREFGTIYEGLLESSLSRAEQDLTVDARGAYLPAGPDDQVQVPAGQVYHHNASGERKSTGSYFTKPFIVEHLLERALDPALGRHLAEVANLLDSGDEAGAAERFFDFRVADLAMGSGHFLVAAVDRIEAKMAAFLVDHPIPRITEELNRLEQAARAALGPTADDHTIEPSALLRRQIAKRSIYGLDINEIAVELARVATWIHTFVPGLPMSSLDHTLVCANSLTGIGTIDEAMNALEPGHAEGTYSIYADRVEAVLARAQDVLRDVAASSEATKAEVQDAYTAYQRARSASSEAIRVFDAAIGLRSGLAPDLIDTLDTPQSGPDARLASLEAGHFPVLFPEVFNRPDPGFDVLVGNPPWEKIKIEEHVWWGAHSPGLRGMGQHTRSQRLGELKRLRPDLVVEYEAAVEAAAFMRAVVASGPYPGIGTGDIDMHEAFAWRNWQLLRSGGSMGVVLPRAALAGAGTVKWRKAVLAKGSFSDVIFLTNTGRWAFDMEPRYTISLVVVERGTDAPVVFAGPFHSVEEFLANRGRPIVVPRDEFVGWSDGLSFPQLTDPRSGEILRLMKRHPAFGDDPAYDLRPYVELHTTANKDLYEFDLDNARVGTPILGGASFNLWNPDLASPYARADEQKVASYLLGRARNGVGRSRSAFFGMRIEGPEDIGFARARVAFRDIARANDTRTAIFCLVPPGVGLVDTAPFLLRRAGSPRHEAYVVGIASSIPFDWYIRRWVELHLKFYILDHAPVPAFRNTPVVERVVEIAGTLAAVNDRYKSWAEAVGVPTGGLSGEAKDEAIAELDALTALLYGLSWEDVEHVFATFHRGWDFSDRLQRVRAYFESRESES